MCCACVWIYISMASYRCIRNRVMHTHIVANANPQQQQKTERIEYDGKKEKRIENECQWHLPLKEKKSEAKEEDGTQNVQTSKNSEQLSAVDRIGCAKASRARERNTNISLDVAHKTHAHFSTVPLPDTLVTHCCVFSRECFNTLLFFVLFCFVSFFFTWLLVAVLSFCANRQTSCFSLFPRFLSFGKAVFRFEPGNFPL